MAIYINGPQPDPYYIPAECPSEEDEQVYSIYERLKDIVDNPENYTPEEISYLLSETEDDYQERYGRYSGNYKAHLSDNRMVVLFYNKYKSEMVKYKRNVTIIKNKEYEKDRDKVIALSSLRRKIPDDLGKTIYKLIEKVNEISDDKEMLSDSEDDN